MLFIIKYQQPLESTARHKGLFADYDAGAIQATTS